MNNHASPTRILSDLINTGPGHAALTLAGRLQRRTSDQHWNQLLVLTYHNVPDAARFETHMRFLARHYHPVALHEVLDAFYDDGPPLPPHALLVTFDDAYRSFAQCAWPVMQRANIPTTLFVATAFPGDPNAVYWWDRLEEAVLETARRDLLHSPVGPLPLAAPAQRRSALKQLKKYLWRLPQTELLAWVHELCGRLGVTHSQSRVLTWDQLRRLKRQGVTLAPHSRTHPDMSRLSREEARREIAGSLADLQRETGDSVLPIFAYPGGRYNRETLTALAQENFLLAFATLRGANDLTCVRQAGDPTARFLLRRNHIDDAASLATLQSRLLYGARFLNRYHALRKKNQGVET